MSDVAKAFIVWVLAVPIALMIVFVRAGQYGGRSGGAQTADILNSAGGSLGGLAKDLNGA